MLDFNQREQMREDVREFLYEQNFELFVTLTTNSPMYKLGQLRAGLRIWDARVNRAALGKNGYKRLYDRIYWWALPEKLDVNPHWHLLLSIGDTARYELNERDPLNCERDVIRSSWTDCFRGGTVDIQDIWSDGAIDYATKCFRDPSCYENFVISTEFHPDH